MNAARNPLPLLLVVGLAAAPVAGAVANAIQNALGVRFYDLPITRDKILAALQSPTVTRKSWGCRK